LVKVSQLLYLFIVFCATGCFVAAPTAESRTPIGQVEVVSETPMSTMPPTPADYPWVDESSVVSGMCFEAASDMAAMRRRFVLRSGTEHIEFYDAIDSTNLCLHPIERVSFDFSTGRALAGFWSVGQGCTARHEVTAYSEADDVLNIALRFVTDGDCNYELVRPFWINFDGDLTLNWMVEGE
jgi:hypothetical protein